MLLTCENIIKILPIVRFELYKENPSFLIPTNLRLRIKILLDELLIIILKNLQDGFARTKNNLISNKKNKNFKKKIILIAIISIVPIVSLFYMGNPLFSVIM